MASYSPIGALSPNEDNRLESERMLFDSDEEQESGTPGPSGGAGDSEQRQGLLSKESPDDEPAIRPRRMDLSGNRSWVIWIFSVCIIAVMIIFDLWLVTRGDSSSDVSPASPSASPGLSEYLNLPLQRADEDYILDSKWDFSAASQERQYDWTILEKDGNPDGVYKPMMTINGQFPGPLIEANEGDTIVVNVHNLATNATAIHWHGIFQNGSVWMDGTSGVTQCPITPGSSFQYKFTVKGQSGTYFYHGHQGVQTLDGLVGPLIIHSRDERTAQPLAYVSDRVILLHDWYYDPAEGLMRKVLSPGNEDSPIPNAALINGVNHVDCSLHSDRRCEQRDTSFPTIDVTPGDNHRLRFINLGGYAWFQVSVDEHTDLPVIEIDGTPIEAAPESDIILSPGQRYSAILTANTGAQSDNDSFWLRARMIKACFSEPRIPENGSDEARAIIRYTSTSTSTQASSSTTAQALPTTNNTNHNYPMICKDMTARARYRPFPPQPAPESADHSWHIRVNLAIGNWRLQRGVMNSTSFRPNLKSPTLHRILDGLSSSNESFNMEGVNTAAFDKQELVVAQRGIETVDIILQNMDENNHPFHLHGHQFWVMGAGHGYFPGYKKLGLKPYGKGLLDPTNRTVIENPLKRDVATAEGFGWVWLRFVADNPGIWLFHCHMIWHSEAGMAMQFLSRLDDMRSWKLPDEAKELCNAPEEELRLGAPPKDEVFFGFHND